MICVNIVDARDLGVVLDSQLSLSSHVDEVCRAGFFHLRQLRPAIQSMSTAAARFTKNLPGLYNVPYLERIRKLKLERLDVRRL